ncbi:hypothetical protein B005_2147 [Nocardiopsis alba ATCC BAA-2165]|uniref:Uncharacterized protein n=1 Tax=Nocardiopsis alba (strain ATCC BAA-2165 / BE74) TaxID=1205910 RepID=J7LJ65_NOCAA|nr:hypothetical protein B005_2147 [Nocardiopsis alba ATCC BAA-2165]
MTGDGAHGRTARAPRTSWNPPRRTTPRTGHAPPTRTIDGPATGPSPRDQRGGARSAPTNEEHDP